MRKLNVKRETLNIRNKTYSKIIVTGSVAYDQIMDFPSQFVDYFHPQRLHQINVSFVVDDLKKQLGGTATNIAYNLKLLTKKKVVLLGAVGRDGGRLLQFYKKNNIDAKGITRDKKVFTASGSVITDIKDNQIWGYYYGASYRAKEIKLEEYVDNNSLVIISANHKEAFIHFQKQAIKLGIDYLYDPGMSLSWINKKDLRDGIDHCRFLVGNDYEIAQILRFLKTDKSSLLKRNIAVITTLGEQGVKYQDKRNKYFVTAYRIKKTIDPTGAGDAWRGGFVAGLVEGKSIIDSLKQANALASFAVEYYGTVNHRPKIAEISRRIKSLKIVVDKK